MSDKTVAVMQPYLFPYLGYFQLIAAADIFVFYDDVDFITRGWVNRNRILINDSPSYFTVSCSNASQNTKIKDVRISNAWRPGKMIKKIRLAYANAREFDSVFPVVKRVIEEAGQQISTVAQNSVCEVASYLDMDVDFHRSSDLPADESLGRADRLIEISKHFEANTYINMEGGKTLYDKSYFASKGIALHFLEPSLPGYDQRKAEGFEPGLSIIDVMMNLSKEETQTMLQEFQLT